MTNGNGQGRRRLEVAGIIVGLLILWTSWRTGNQLTDAVVAAQQERERSQAQILKALAEAHRDRESIGDGVLLRLDRVERKVEACGH